MSRAIRHILCWVDGSEPACRAAEQAADLAVALSADLTYVAVAREAPRDGAYETFKKMEGLEGHPPPLLLPADAQACLAAAISSSKAKGHSNANRIVRSGKVLAALISTASEVGADTIVIGLNRHAGFRHRVLGSVSQQIAHQTTHTIILVA